ncbi:MAG: M50 family metallopeptidase [Pyrinomonadaceae bacterium]|nr:M50 family metallopeptidase [Pyrinomonadaceae bacterium]MCX7639829.1 M50 family metallopeptidase [Pyrinomonadaceae bacterium]MDW8304001.1 M50 family metallopeptidase [Acidobacteriota bacterium]
MKVAKDAKSQVKLIMAAVFVTMILWFIPFVDWIVYPLRLFVTFIHESCHAIVGALTGSSVKGLVVLANGSGFVLVSSDNWFSSFLTSSAGYLGTTFCGAVLLVLLRYRANPQGVLIGLSVLTSTVTFLFAFLIPSLNFYAFVGFKDVVFTSLVGFILSCLLLSATKLDRAWQEAGLAFLAVQLILNAFLDLKTLFFLNAPILGSDINTDATNMARITGLPAVFWILIWIVVSVLIVSITLRLYAISRRRNESLFEDLD